MDIIDMLLSEECWESFLEYKLSKNSLRKAEKEDLIAFVRNKEFIDPVTRISTELKLTVPSVSRLNKKGSDKKRIVFTFCREENYVLKLLAFLLKDYDSLFADNLYSFRRNSGVKHALNAVMKKLDYSKTYSYKVDIHDYFNSVNTDFMIKILRDAIPQQKRLIQLLVNVLTDPYASDNGKIITIRKGIMAGVPFSGFLANLYLREMDEWFYENNARYIRYSDDIIVLSEDKNEIIKYEKTIRKYLEIHKLTVNEKKEAWTTPGDNIEFLGFSFSLKQIDISKITLKKLKNKLKRKARSLYRWRLKKGLEGEKAAIAYIRYLNAKFYNNPVKNEITWCRWYFPVITTDNSLKVIDQYCIDCIRYLYTGRYGKQNYNIRYETIKGLGFQSLVNNYWKYKTSN